MQYARGRIVAECDDCGAEFASRDDLDRHELQCSDAAEVEENFVISPSPEEQE